MTTQVLLSENSVPFIRGVSKTLTLTVVNLSGDPVDLTGASVYFTVKREIFDRVPVITKTTSNVAEVAITNPKGGIASIYIDPADTQNLDIHPFVFDVWVVLPSGKRYCVVKEAVLDIQPSVTVLAL